MVKAIAAFLGVFLGRTGGRRRRGCGSRSDMHQTLGLVFDSWLQFLDKCLVDFLRACSGSVPKDIESHIITETDDMDFGSIFGTSKRR